MIVLLNNIRLKFIKVFVCYLNFLNKVFNIIVISGNNMIM